MPGHAKAAKPSPCLGSSVHPPGASVGPLWTRDSERGTRDLVFLDEGLLPAEVVDHVVGAPVGADGNDVIGGCRHAREALPHGQSRLAPGGHPAGQPGDVPLAQFPQGHRGQGGAAAVAVRDNNRLRPVRCDVAGPQLPPASREPARPRDVALGELTAGVHEEDRGGSSRTSSSWTESGRAPSGACSGWAGTL